MQWLAMITMLIDHLGFAFFQDERSLRLIGRIAFPIYCYLLVVGYRYTRNKGNYATRLLIIALLSQFPFMYAFNISNLNVVFTLLFGLLLLIALDKMPRQPSVSPLTKNILLIVRVLVSLLLVGAVAWIAQMLHTDYGAYGIFLILIFRYTSSYAMVLAHFVLNVTFILLLLIGYSQMYSLFATMLIAALPYVATHFQFPRPPRWLWRAFYPAHLAIIAMMVQGIQYGYLL